MITIALLFLAVAAGCVSPTAGGTITPTDLEQPPAAISFTADQAELHLGECTTLQWSVIGGFGVNLDGQHVERSGQTRVCPQETTTYRLEVDTGITLARKEVVIVVSGSAGLLPEGLASAAGIEVRRDIEYGRYRLNGQEHALLLDIYLPDQDSAGHPLIVFIHGGGWMEGSKDDCPAVSFVMHGYAVACIDYRLAPMSGSGCPAELIFPSQVHDAKAAVRWLREHAGGYALAPDRFAVMGASSGGHLASLLGTSYGAFDVAGAQNLGASDAVQGVVDWYGPVDVTQPPPQIVFKDDPCLAGFAALGTKYGGEATPYFYWTFAWGSFLGGSLTDPRVEAQAKRATPLAYVDAGDPPFLIIHGEADDMVPIQQSELLVTALQKAGVDVTFVRASGGHGYSGGGHEVVPAYLQPTLEFLDRVLSR